MAKEAAAFRPGRRKGPKNSLYADTDAPPPGYVVLLELRYRPEGVSDADIRSCLKEKLMEANEDIIEDFEGGHLADPRLVVLQPETYLLTATS